MNKKLLVSALFLALAPMLASAGETIHVYPVPGIFFDEGADNQKGVASKISPEIGKVLKANIRQNVGYAGQAIAKNFNNLTQQIDAKNRYRTLAVSVQVTRASRFEVNKKDGTRDIYLPLTLSLYFSNPLTGEVLQSFNQTRVTTFTSTPDTIAAKISQYTQQSFERTLDELLTHAASQFKPYVVEATVKETWKGYGILDKGYAAGIGKDDILLDTDGNEIKIEHAGQDYAVATPIGGKISSGGRYARTSMMKLSDVKKPRVLVVVSDGNADIPDAVMSQLFADQLGADAQFAVLPLNANYGKVQSAIDSNTQIGSAVSGQRELPDYFTRLVVPDVVEYEKPTNLTYKTQRHYKSWAFAELLAKNGQVLFARHADENLQDVVTNGIGIAAADRREVALKNALVELADKFSKEVKFKHTTLEITSAENGQLWVDDTAQVLQLGQAVRIYREISKDVLVPTWEARVEAREGGRIALRTQLEIAGSPPAPSKGDKLLIDQINTPAGGAMRLAYCPNPKSQVGSQFVPRYDELAYAVAAQTGFNMVNRSLKGLVERRVGSASGFKANIKLPEAAFDQCLESLYRIDPVDSPCEGDACSTRYKVKTAFRQKQGDTVSQQMILEHTFKTSGYQQNIDSTQLGQLQRAELYEDVGELLKQTAKNLFQTK